MTPSSEDRYSRQVRFKPIGQAGQQRLLASHVAVAGCGALGTFQAEALARAGIGTLTLIDRDYVEWSNLQRQWLFDEDDARQGLPKAAAAAKRLAAVNGACDVRVNVVDLNASNIEDLCENADLLLDATDNFDTRYLINDYAMRTGTPWVYGAAVGSYGVVMPVLPHKTACLACVYPDPPGGIQPTCETAGVLNAVTGAVAALQVAAAMRILLGVEPEELRRSTVDVWTGDLRSLPVQSPQADCRVCGRGEYVYLEGTRRTPASLCGRNAVQLHERNRPIDLRRLAQSLSHFGDVRINEFALRFFIPPYELTVFRDGRAIIKGTTDIGIAKSLYARYIGA